MVRRLDFSTLERMPASFVNETRGCHHTGAVLQRLCARAAEPRSGSAVRSVRCCCSRTPGPSEHPKGEMEDVDPLSSIRRLWGHPRRSERVRATVHPQPRCLGTRTSGFLRERSRTSQRGFLTPGSAHAMLSGGRWSLALTAGVGTVKMSRSRVNLRTSLAAMGVVAVLCATYPPVTPQLRWNTERRWP